jgi:hypothetical protein
MVKGQPLIQAVPNANVSTELRSTGRALSLGRTTSRLGVVCDLPGFKFGQRICHHSGCLLGSHPCFVRWIKGELSENPSRHGRIWQGIAADAEQRPRRDSDAAHMSQGQQMAPEWRPRGMNELHVWRTSCC